MNLIGIDPSFTNMGVAVYTPETSMLRMYSGDFITVIRKLNCENDYYAVVENVSGDSSAWYAEKIMKKAKNMPFQKYIIECRKALKYAQRVGKSKAACDLILKWLQEKNIKTVKINPSQRDRADGNKNFMLCRYPTKTNKEQFHVLTGYTARSNEHERDAAMLVFGKTSKWAEMMSK